jgi:hypothetical protein
MKIRFKLNQIAKFSLYKISRILSTFLSTNFDNYVDLFFQ